MSRIRDVGEKIGGARKDQVNIGLRISDLDAMSEAEAISLVVKNKVWPEPDYAALVDGGMRVEQAALLKIVRSKVAAKPVKRGSQEADKVRRDYIRAIEAIRSVLETPRDFVKVRTLFEDFAKQIHTIMDPVGETCGAITSANTRTIPIYYGYKEERVIATMITEGFPGDIPAWRRGLKTHTETGGTIAIYRGNKGVGRGFPDVESAMAFAKSSYETAAPRVPALPPLPVPPHLDKLERIGPDHRGGGDVDPQHFIDVLGFRGVEFGESLPQKERQLVVNMGWDAIHDLADVMGVPPAAISMGGFMAVAFAARGRGGKAAAHYEPGRRVFNLTRLNGAGKIAHEWAHGLDHCLGESGPHVGDGMQIRSATGWEHGFRNGYEHLSGIDPNLPERFAALMHTLARTPRTEAEILDDRKTSISGLETRIPRFESVMARLREGSKDWKATNDSLQTAQRRLARLQSTEWRIALPSTRQSDFLTQAERLDRGRAKIYWSQPCEIYARTFECFVADRLSELGRQSDYLVHSVAGELYQDGYRGNPYPLLGAERTAFMSAHTAVIETIAPFLSASVEPEPDLDPIVVPVNPTQSPRQGSFSF